MDRRSRVSNFHDRRASEPEERGRRVDPVPSTGPGYGGGMRAFPDARGQYKREIDELDYIVPRSGYFFEHDDRDVFNPGPGYRRGRGRGYGPPRQNRPPPRDADHGRGHGSGGRDGRDRPGNASREASGPQPPRVGSKVVVPGNRTVEDDTPAQAEAPQHNERHDARTLEGRVDRGRETTLGQGDSGRERRRDGNRDRELEPHRERERPRVEQRGRGRARDEQGEGENGARDRAQRGRADGRDTPPSRGLSPGQGRPRERHRERSPGREQGPAGCPPPRSAVRSTIVAGDQVRTAPGDYRHATGRHDHAAAPRGGSRYDRPSGEGRRGGERGPATTARDGALGHPRDSDRRHGGRGSNLGRSDGGHHTLEQPARLPPPNDRPRDAFSKRGRKWGHDKFFEVVSAEDVPKEEGEINPAANP